MTKAKILWEDQVSSQHVVMAGADFETYRAIRKNPFDKGGVAAALVDEQCVAVGGVKQIHTELGELFLIADPKKVPPAAWIQFSACVPIWLSRFNRVQAFVDLYSAEGLRFCRYLKLRPEGIVNNVGPNGETWVMFVSIRGIDR